MLRELNLNEMEMVSGGSEEEDVIIVNGVRHTADDGGTVGPPSAPGTDQLFYSSITGQVYETSDERGIAEGIARGERTQNQENNSVPIKDRRIGPRDNGQRLLGYQIDGITVGVIRDGTSVTGAGVNVTQDF